jgi:RNA polymerase sigma factor (sigma-70 family)
MLGCTTSAIADLMQKHRSELLCFLSQRVCCVETAQDLFQETFIRYAGYGDKDRIENPRAFIFRIAANLAIDHLRVRGRRIEVAQEDDDMDDFAIQDISPERAVMSEQEVENLVHALAELPPKCRDVFIMLRIKQNSYAEVEQKLGISQTMILKYLNRALTHCRQRLEAGH